MPAIAIADTVKRNRPRAEILFVGGSVGMERALVERAGYSIKTLEVRGIPRRLSLDTWQALKTSREAAKEARKWLEGERPDLVIGTGGYASYPALRAATDMGIPTAIHESNAVAGLAVRALARHVDRVWLNFAEAGKGLRVRREKLLVVGNPQIERREAARHAEAPPLVLSFGGSLGAAAINRAALSIMPKIASMKGIYHLHATGAREYEDFLAKFREAGLDACPRIRVVPFIDDMPDRMASATVVICRAGAMSISELAHHRAPAILVPSPNVTGNHQYKNAAVLARAGAARLIEEEGLERELWKAVETLLTSDTVRGEMKERIALFAHPDANKIIFEDICRLAGL